VNAFVVEVYIASSRWQINGVGGRQNASTAAAVLASSTLSSSFEDALHTTLNGMALIIAHSDTYDQRSLDGRRRGVPTVDPYRAGGN
jgi:hypothetical protein